MMRLLQRCISPEAMKVVRSSPYDRSPLHAGDESLYLRRLRLWDRTFLAWGTQQSSGLHSRCIKVISREVARIYSLGLCFLFASNLAASHALSCD